MNESLADDPGRPEGIRDGRCQRGGQEMLDQRIREDIRPAGREPEAQQERRLRPALGMGGIEEIVDHLLPADMQAEKGRDVAPHAA